MAGRAWVVGARNGLGPSAASWLASPGAAVAAGSGSAIVGKAAAGSRAGAAAVTAASGGSASAAGSGAGGSGGCASAAGGCAAVGASAAGGSAAGGAAAGPSACSRPPITCTTPSRASRSGKEMEALPTVTAPAGSRQACAAQRWSEVRRWATAQPSSPAAQRQPAGSGPRTAAVDHLRPPPAGQRDAAVLRLRRQALQIVQSEAASGGQVIEQQLPHGGRLRRRAHARPPAAARQQAAVGRAQLLPQLAAERRRREGGVGGRKHCRLEETGVSRKEGGETGSARGLLCCRAWARSACPPPPGHRHRHRPPAHLSAARPAGQTGLRPPGLP